MSALSCPQGARRRPRGQKGACMDGNEAIARVTFGGARWEIDAQGHVTISPDGNGVLARPDPGDVTMAEATTLRVEQGCKAPHDSSWLFSGLESLRRADLTSLDMRDVTDASHMFEGDARLEHVGWPSQGPALGAFDVSDMFRHAGIPEIDGGKYMDRWKLVTEQKLERGARLPIDGGIQAVSNGVRWVLRGYRLDIMPASPSDTGAEVNAETLRKLFDRSHLTHIREVVYHEGLRARAVVGESVVRLAAVASCDISGLDVGGRTYFESAFARMERLERLELGVWDMGAASWCDDMFEGCKRLRRLDLSGLRMREVLTANRMFCGCESLETLALPAGFGEREGLELDGMFDGCTSLAHVKADPELAYRVWDATGTVLPGFDKAGIHESHAERLAESVRPCADALNASAQVGDGFAWVETGGACASLCVGRKGMEVRMTVLDDSGLEYVESVSGIAASVLEEYRAVAQERSREVDYLRYNPDELGTTHTADVHDVEDQVTLTPTDTADVHPVTDRDMQSLTLERNAGGDGRSAAKRGR